MTIKIKLHRRKVVGLYEVIRFPGGEPHVKLDVKAISSADHIVVEMQEFDFPLLAVCVDALRRTKGSLILDLFLPYFPGARQDRACEPGEALTARVYADMVNSLGFRRVTIMDPHSDVVPALVNGCEVIPHGRLKGPGDWGYEILETFFSGRDDTLYVVAPDAGATKKVLAAINRSNKLKRPVVFAQGGKVRDTKNGRLAGFSLDQDDLHDGQVVIMDDINCRGGTFVGLAALLRQRGAGEITLFTTHLDTRVGVESVLANGIDKVMTTNSSKAWNSPGELPDRPEQVIVLDVFN